MDLNATFKITHHHNGLPQKELYLELYLHHFSAGPNQTQSEVIQPKRDNYFGAVVINDWPLYDSLGPDAKLVARAQGLHVKAGTETLSWYNSFSMVFEDARFKGSTLQVMGTSVRYGEWAIVGGTGEFTRAQGVIYKKMVKEDSNGDIIELRIHAFYYPMQKPTERE